MSSKQIDLLNWKKADDHVDEAIRKANWVNLCAMASQLNHRLPCAPLDKITNGLHNAVRILEFSDKTRWIARIGLRSRIAGSIKLQNEVSAMQLIKERSSLPVPKVFAYEVDENNPAGIPFILMEFIPGNTGMDAAGGYEMHKGHIPTAYRGTFYRSVARCHVQLTSLRFSQIGSIVMKPDGQYSIGPIPLLGGPFDTATEFFNAWAACIKFPLSDGRIRELMGRGPTEEILRAIHEFPSQIKAMSSRLSQTDRGPFPLCHGDFLHSNMIVNEDFELAAVIDWESASTYPLELVEFPSFLKVMPVQFGSSGDYDKDGLPLDEEEKQKWKERQDYLQMVKSFEDKDHVLSTCLGNEKSLALAYCMMAYSNGKLGFYDRVVNELKINSAEGI
ncbi:protein kinase-like protein [Apiospora arundinis]|uniref:Protein kinase-like protein n=1 Tax=Apiospora arundinis TaxID=335852 RepID=A0ABR2I966_9PEZI